MWSCVPALLLHTPGAAYAWHGYADISSTCATPTHARHCHNVMAGTNTDTQPNRASVVSGMCRTVASYMMVCVCKYVCKITQPYPQGR